MAAHRLHQYKSIMLRRLHYRHKFNHYKLHHRLFHLNIYHSRSRLHSVHLRKFWKKYTKYTLLISLSAIGLSISYKSSTTNIVSADTIKEEKESKESMESMEDKEAIDHLIRTITVPKHNWIVWMWLFFSRFIFLVYNFTPMIVLAPFAYWNIFGLRAYWLNLVHDSFANGGSTFIKLGQWISMRSDIFPIEICDHLSELRYKYIIYILLTVTLK